MKLLIYSLLIFFISACGKISAPSIITPDYSQRVSEGGYGDAPLTYTNILKKYLINKLPNHQETKIEFINEPQKLSIDHLGDNYSGYRVCLSINEKQDGYYRGWRNHFFMIKLLYIYLIRAYLLSLLNIVLQEMNPKLCW